MKNLHPSRFTSSSRRNAALLSLFLLCLLPPTQDLGNIRFRSGDAPIDVTGPGLHVVRLSALRVETGALLPIISDSTTEALTV